MNASATNGPRRYLLVVIGAALLPSARPASPFVMGTDQPESALFGKFLRRVHGEAFRRLGVPLQIAYAPTQRLGLLLDQGDIDGDAVRAMAFAAAHPDAIRVDEWLLDDRFALYATDTSMALRHLDELQGSNLRVLYRRGVVYCERTLARLPPERLSNVTTTSQGLKMLLAGRADVYCDIDSSVLQALDEEPSKAPAVRKLLDLQSAALYPYLHARHAELAPRLAAVLKQMKSEGLLDRYLREAQQAVAAK
jgi:polar amino acid transport system substrate-binding protein